MASEFDLIAQFFTRPLRHTELGVGDDGAVIRPSANCELVISTDLLVEGTHFFSDVDPESLGWKTLAVNLSDMAAMGATPRWATLGCVLYAPVGNGVSPSATAQSASCARPPCSAVVSGVGSASSAPTGTPSASEPWLGDFSRGFFSCADRYGVDLIGGDTTRGHPGASMFSVTIIGEVPCGQAIRRDGAQVGDTIWVSGTPGRAATGLAHLRGQVQLAGAFRDDCLAALHRPTPRIELGLALRGLASSAIDVSDGLLADLGHILITSRVSARLQMPELPDTALAREMYLAGGDDYELVFTIAAKRAPEIVALGEALGLPLRQIGIVCRDQPGTLTVHDSGGFDITPARRGFDHFADRIPNPLPPNLTD